MNTPKQHFFSSIFSVRVIAMTACIMSVLSLAMSIWAVVGSRGHRIAYVRSNDLIYGYKAMKTAQERYQEKERVWKENIDKLEEDLQTSVNSYKAEYVSLSKEDQKKREQQLEMKRANYVKYSEAIKAKSGEEEQNMMQGVLNQINSFAEQYGKEHGYDLVFGTTAAGNILYGNNTMDITEEVLKALNQSYGNGEKNASKE